MLLPIPPEDSKLLITTEPPRLASITLIRRYPDEDVRRTQFQFEDEFKGFVRGQTQAVSAQGGIEIPKFLMTDGKRTLVVSNISTQLSLEFGATLPSKSSLKDVLTRPTSVMDEALTRIFPGQKIFYSAIVVVWAATQSDQSGLAEELAQWLLKPTFRPSLASLNTTVGLERNGTNRTIELSQYKQWQRLTTGTNSTIFIDPDFEKPDDQGLQIKVDVNTKPQIAVPPVKAFGGLIDVLRETLTVDLPNLIGPSLSAALPQ
jgi:hypothetical protein